jgi:transposase InsO family protein
LEWIAVMAAVVSSAMKSLAALPLENVALRHQIGVLQRSAKKRRSLNQADRLFWIGLSRMWAEWRSALKIVKPDTVIAWHRNAFRKFWTWKVRRGRPGRPAVSADIPALIHRTSRENPGWVHLAFTANCSSWASTSARPASPSIWRAADTVPTIRFQILYVFLVLAHERRIVHFAVTAHPTAEWTAHQLREAFPWESAPRYLLSDRDRIFGHGFVEQLKAMGIKQVLSAPRWPWQRAHVERVIGSIRRECLDHLIVFNKPSLKHHLTAYCFYSHRTRTHSALEKDCPESREV